MKVCLNGICQVGVKIQTQLRCPALSNHRGRTTGGGRREERGGGRCSLYWHGERASDGLLFYYLMYKSQGSCIYCTHLQLLQNVTLGVKDDKKNGL